MNGRIFTPHQTIRRVLVFVLPLTLGACSVGPRYERPSLAIPAGWNTTAQGEVWPSMTWWQGFGSTRLDEFIAEAGANNLDLAAAAARVREADAQVRIAGASLLPLVTLGSSAARIRPSASTAATGRSVASGLYDAELSASYEIDFWGKNRATVAAAKATAQANRYNEETVALTTVASVATTYFSILEQRDLIAVAQQNLASAEDVLKALKAQEAAGIASALDVAQQETTVATLEAELPPLQQALRQFTDALAILVGKPPEAIETPRGTLARLSHPTVAPGLPSALLARRPDVAMAEAQLIAANANITVARAAFFPSIQLTAQGGFESTALSSLFGPAGSLYNLAASATQPIFEGGALTGQLAFSKATYDELLQDYRKAVIAAFQDVEDSLIAAQQTTEQERRDQTAVDTARRAYDVSLAQLRAGTVNILTVLNTETALFTAENSLVEAKLARLNAMVSLFRSLGGGGWTENGGTSA